MGQPQNAYIPHASIRDSLGGCAVDVYDFAVHGGAVGTITLPLEIPDNAIITEAYADVITDPTSDGSATVALGLNTNADLLAATAIASVTGVVSLLPSYTAALDGNAAAGGVEASSPVKLTADRKLKMTIATAALTAGKIAVYVKWVGPLEDIVSR